MYKMHKAIEIPRIFSKNSQAKNVRLSISFNLETFSHIVNS